MNLFKTKDFFNDDGWRMIWIIQLRCLIKWRMNDTPSYNAVQMKLCSSYKCGRIRKSTHGGDSGGGWIKQTQDFDWDHAVQTRVLVLSFGPSAGNRSCCDKHSLCRWMFKLCVSYPFKCHCDCRVELIDRLSCYEFQVAFVWTELTNSRPEENHVSVHVSDRCYAEKPDGDGWSTILLLLHVSVGNIALFTPPDSFSYFTKYNLT